jgi:RNA polymerase sigma-70 factor (ECF subfamily)
MQMQERELQRANSAPVEPSEAELISGCRAGQPEMLAELVKRYQPAVLRICISVLSSRDVDDLVQEIFIKILERFDRFAGRSALFTWMYEIALNHCRDELRRRKRRRWFSLQTLPQHAIESIPDLEKNMSEQIETRELHRILHREIHQLKPKYRELIVLRDLEGLSYDDIANICRIDARRVKSRLFAARRALAERMRMYYPEEDAHARA